ncbi:hypothetical protein GC173_07970 [bacterium]|nr:hypothetical protein [bacterium]
MNVPVEPEKFKGGLSQPAWLTVLVLCAMLGAFAWLDLNGLESVVGDTITYVVPAKALLQGNGYSVIDGQGDVVPYFHRTPGYSVFLMPFLAMGDSSGVACAVAVQRLLHGFFLALILIASARCLSGAARLAAVGAVVTTALCPSSLIAASRVLSDWLAVSLVVGGLALLIAQFSRNRSAEIVAAGVLVGAACLVRPTWTVLLVAMALCAILLTWRPAMRRVARDLFVVVAIASVFPLGWMARNYAVGGSPTLSPLVGYNLLLHRAGSLATITGEGKSPVATAILAHLQAGESVTEALEKVDAEFDENRLVVDAEAATLAKEAIASNPLGYFRSSAGNAITLITSPSDWFEFLFPSEDDPRRQIGLGRAIKERSLLIMLVHLVARVAGIGMFVLLPAVLIRQHTNRFTTGVILAVLLWLGVVSSTALTIPPAGRLCLPLVAVNLLLVLSLIAERKRQGAETGVATILNKTGRLAA